jgi:hypothetical protein
LSILKVQGNASGTGIFTIASPNGNTDRTLTLPDNTGTIALQGGTGVGKVLQVVQVEYATQVSTTSSTLSDTGLSATITPTSASSKVLVIVSQAMLAASGSGDVTINRAGTDVVTFGYGTGLGGSNTAFNQSFQYLDSPSTTSATTYKTRFNRRSGAATVYAQYGDGNGQQRSIITLMEIAA